MLGSKKSGYSISGHTTLVSRDTVIVGDIHFSGNLDVEGLVQGNIIALPEKEALVRVVHGGRVEGEIHVPCIVINGTVDGVVYSTRHLELATHGRVNGDVFYTRVEMAAGSEVNGILKHIVETVSADSEAQEQSVGADVSHSDSTVAEITEGQGRRRKS